MHEPGDARCRVCCSSQLAVSETAVLLHPPLPSAGVSIGMKRGCHQNDSLADGYSQRAETSPPGGLCGVLLIDAARRPAVLQVQVHEEHVFRGVHVHRAPVRSQLAEGETVILLHPPLHLVGVSTGVERGCQ